MRRFVLVSADNQDGKEFFIGIIRKTQFYFLHCRQIPVVSRNYTFADLERRYDPLNLAVLKSFNPRKLFKRSTPKTVYTEVIVKQLLCDILRCLPFISSTYD